MSKVLKYTCRFFRNFLRGTQNLSLPPGASYNRYATAGGRATVPGHRPNENSKILFQKKNIDWFLENMEYVVFDWELELERVIRQSQLCYSSGSGSGLYSGGLTWSIVLRCDDHTGIFTCDGCARDPYFYVPAETQSYVIKLSCSRKVLAASGD